MDDEIKTGDKVYPRFVVGLCELTSGLIATREPASGEMRLSKRTKGKFLHWGDGTIRKFPVHSFSKTPP